MRPRILHAKRNYLFYEWHLSTQILPTSIPAMNTATLGPVAHAPPPYLVRSRS